MRHPVRWKDGMSLPEFAAEWEDMAPHVATLTRFAAEARTVIEWGVRGGVSTWAILDGLEPTARLIAVDIDPEVRSWAPPWVLEDKRLTLVIGDSLSAPYPRTADLVLIDTSHTYDQTTAELDIAADRLKAKRIVCHDWMLAAVHDAVCGFAFRSPLYRLAGIEQSRWGLAWLDRMEPVA